MGKIVDIDKAHILQLEEFSLATANKMQAVEFGNKKTKKRPAKEIARDIMIGKVAELAVAMHLQNITGIRTALDLNIYPRGIGDTADFLFGTHRIDIKATRQTGRYLLISEHNLITRKEQGTLPHSFILVIVGWENDKFSGKTFIGGYTFIEDICDVNKIGTPDIALGQAFYVAAGKKLGGTEMKMQANNLAIHYLRLSNDWIKYSECLKQSSLAVLV